MKRNFYWKSYSTVIIPIWETRNEEHLDLNQLRSKGETLKVNQVTYKL